MLSIVCYVYIKSMSTGLRYLNTVFLSNDLLLRSIRGVFSRPGFADSVSCDKRSAVGTVSYPHVQLIQNLWPITVSIGQRHMTYETIFLHHF